MKFLLAHYLKILGISALTIFLLAGCKSEHAYAYPWYQSDCLEIRWAENSNTGIENGIYCKVEVNVETPQQSPR